MFFKKSSAVASTVKLVTHIGSIASAAVSSANLNESALKRVVARGDEFKQGIIDLLEQLSTPFYSLASLGEGWGFHERQQLPTPAGEFDPATIVFLDLPCAGEMRVAQHRKAGNVVLGVREFLWCMNNPGKLPDHWKRAKDGRLRHVAFDGTIFRHRDSSRSHILVMWWDVPFGQWNWSFFDLEGDLLINCMTPVLPASVPTVRKTGGN